MFKHLRKPHSDFWYVGTTHMTGNEAGRSEGKLSVYLAGSQEAAPPPPLGLAERDLEHAVLLDLLLELLRQDVRDGAC